MPMGRRVWRTRRNIEPSPRAAELNGISARTMEEHYELYKGYIGKTNEIQEKLAGVDRASAHRGCARDQQRARAPGQDRSATSASARARPPPVRTRWDRTPLPSGCRPADR